MYPRCHKDGESVFLGCPVWPGCSRFCLWVYALSVVNASSGCIRLSAQGSFSRGKAQAHQGTSEGLCGTKGSMGIKGAVGSVYSGIYVLWAL